MRKFFRDFLDAFRKGDLVLMTLCMLTTAFGCVIIASATNYMDATRYILIQLVAARSKRQSRGRTIPPAAN